MVCLPKVCKIEFVSEALQAVVCIGSVLCRDNRIICNCIHGSCVQALSSNDAINTRYWAIYFHMSSS